MYHSSYLVFIYYTFNNPKSKWKTASRQNVLFVPKIDIVNIMYFEHCIIPALAHTQSLRTCILLIIAHELSI